MGVATLLHHSAQQDLSAHAYHPEGVCAHHQPLQSSLSGQGGKIRSGGGRGGGGDGHWYLGWVNLVNCQLGGQVFLQLHTLLKSSIGMHFTVDRLGSHGM